MTNNDKLQELYDKAIARFLDDMAFDIEDHLTERERKEYQELYMAENGNCPFCGEILKECLCK